MEPKPNNGTLRLPLKPSGEHKDEDTPPTPDDPEPIAPSKAEAAPSVTAATSITRQAPPTAQPTSTPPGKAEDGKDSDDGLASKIKGAWDWISDKIHGVWDDLTGSQAGESTEKDKNG